MRRTIDLPRRRRVLGIAPATAFDPVPIACPPSLSNTPADRRQYLVPTPRVSDGRHGPVDA